MVFFSQNGTAETLQGFPYQGPFTYESMVQVRHPPAAALPPTPNPNPQR